MLPPVNLPNAITLARLVLVVVFAAAASAKDETGYGIALAVFTLAAASDFLDGYLARRLNLVTSLGKLLDPLVDKILVCTAFVYLTSTRQPDGLPFAPVWVTVVIIGREFLVTGLRQIAVEKGRVIAADGLGKWKTIFQLAFCISSLIWLYLSHGKNTTAFTSFLQSLAAPGHYLYHLFLWAALGLTAVSGFNYLWAGRHLLREPKQAA
jgi:CDP-diacylglycerol--glycerol-3-phosphate 3-phosphatidyltransferase